MKNSLTDKESSRIHVFTNSHIICAVINFLTLSRSTRERSTSQVITLLLHTVYPAQNFSNSAIDFNMQALYFRSMHIEIIQCPKHGIVYKRKDGLQITVGNYITLFFNESVELKLKITTSLGNLTLPLPDDEDLQWFLDAIAKGKFKNRPVTYEYVEARLVKDEKEYQAFLPWYKEED